MKVVYCTVLIFYLINIFVFVKCKEPQTNKLKEKYFDQTIDHFNFGSYGEKTFKQKILYTDAFWKDNGPIFFYTGNEGPIEAFADNTGFMFDIAPEFNAYIVFAEHRYYGASMPFGNSSFELDKVGLLTVEQAMADYAIMISHMKEEICKGKCAVICFGGSYGGMLSAYMRFKYPNLVDGALAASAPIFSVSNDVPNDYFFAYVTKDFREVDEQCPTIVQQGFSKIEELSEEGSSGLKTISDSFKLCSTLKSKTDIPHLYKWIRNSFTFQAMLDYPYPTTFMGKLPGYPVNVSCKALLKMKNDVLTGLAEASGVYYNATQTLKCFDIFKEYVDCADPTGCGLGPAGLAWDYQACTEVVLPSGTNNKTDMFPYLPLTPQQRAAYCQQKWHVTPRTNWLAVQMWGKDLKGASNIVFSNGALDPWRGGGVLNNISDSVVAIWIEHGAHHLDLRSSNPKDPQSVIDARNEEKKNIKKWVDQAQQNKWNL